MKNTLDLSAPKQNGVTNLEHFKVLNRKLNELRAESKAAGIIEYIGIDGRKRTEYFHSGRWNDRLSTVSAYGA